MTCSSCGIWAYNTEAGSVKCYECLTQDAMFGVKQLDQCTITWILLLGVVCVIVLCCGCMCWCKEGCPCKLCFHLSRRREKLTSNVDGHRDRVTNIHSQHYLPPHMFGARSAPSILQGASKEKGTMIHGENAHSYKSSSETLSAFEIDMREQIENPIHANFAKDEEMGGA